MGQYEFHERLKKPRVVGHFPSIRNEFDINPNRSMFVQDVHNVVMPLGGRFSQGRDFSVEMQGSSELAPQAIAILQSLTRGNSYGSPDLKELLSDSVNEIARYLAWGGRVVYEIIRDKENNEAWQLYGFTEKRLFRVLRKYIQVIPKADQRFWKKARVVIPKEDIWVISMPKILGGYRGYRTILKKLSKFSQIGPSFLMDEISEQNWPSYFNPESYRREMDLFTAKTTASFGWHMRSAGLKIWTEFYAMYRFITLNWAKACMREHIINELNQLFQRLNIKAEIVVKGLPTAQEILKTRQQMCEGKISFDDASKKCTVS